MNDKYINVSKFKQSLAKLTVEGDDKKYAEAIARTLSEVVPHLLDDSPAADVQPVKHGRWIPSHPVDVEKEFKCIACQGLVCLPVFAKTCYYDFCPNCGAIMDLKEGDTECQSNLKF